MGQRVARLVLLVVRLGAVPGCGASAPAAAAGCPVTRPNGYAPPDRLAPDWTAARDRSHGNEAGTLFTILWPDGEVVFRPGGPGEEHADGSLEMKWPWWRTELGEGKVAARTVDGPRAPVEPATLGYGAGFHPTSLRFPAVGCWAVTATSGGATLTFVTRVVDLRG